MKNGLLDIGIISFVFGPLALTVTLLILVLRNRIKDSRGAFPTMDTPELLLTLVVRRMPEERREWGTAMMTELSQVQPWVSRCWFAVGCAGVALFPPRHHGLPRSASPVCGVLAVALPPLGLPFIYFTAVIVEAVGGSPFTSSRWSNPDAIVEVLNILVKLMFFSLMAGLPLASPDYFVASGCVGFR